MTTTIMRDSIVGDDWIRRTLAACPVQPVIDPTTGQPTGDFITGPVRLAFFNAFTLPPPSPKEENPKFGGSMLFTPEHDLSLLNAEVARVAWETFQDKYNAETQQYYGVRFPFRNQAEKSKFNGFTPGAMFCTATSQFKPPIVDIRGNPITDPAKVYPGVWAIPTVNCYAYTNPKNPGVGFGLQSVMIIGDDTNTGGGGGADTNVQYAQIKGAISAPTVTAGQVQSAQPSAPGAPPAPPMPGAHGMPPGAAPSAPPVPPAAPYAPPAAHQPAMPPAAAPPPAGLPGMAPAQPQYTPQELADMRAMGMIQ